MLAYGSIIFDIYWLAGIKKYWEEKKWPITDISWTRYSIFRILIFSSGLCTVNDVYQIVLSFCPLTRCPLCLHFRSKFSTRLCAMHMHEQKIEENKNMLLELRNSIYPLNRCVSSIDGKTAFANRVSISNALVTFIELIFIKNGPFANEIVFSQWNSMVTIWFFLLNFSIAPFFRYFNFE